MAATNGKPESYSPATEYIDDFDPGSGSPIRTTIVTYDDLSP